MDSRGSTALWGWEDSGIADTGLTAICRPLCGTDRDTHTPHRGLSDTCTRTHRHTRRQWDCNSDTKTDIFFQRNPAETLVDGRHDSIMFLTTKPELIENTSSQQGRNAWHTVGFPYIGRHFHSWIRVHNILAATIITITTCTCSNVPAHYRVTDTLFPH